MILPIHDLVTTRISFHEQNSNLLNPKTIVRAEISDGTVLLGSIIKKLFITRAGETELVLEDISTFVLKFDKFIGTNSKNYMQFSQSNIMIRNVLNVNEYLRQN